MKLLESSLHQKTIAPQAKKNVVIHEKHGHHREDPYFWMNERDSEDVLAYLEAENTYADHVLKPLDKLQSDLFEELKSRIKDKDESVPYLFNGFYYYQKYEPGQDYPIYLRAKTFDKQDEEVLLDVNEIAKDQNYCQVNSFSVSNDNRWLAFGIDTIGRRQYRILIKDLVNDFIYDDGIENTTGSVAWDGSNDRFYYVQKNETTLRSEAVILHEIGDLALKDKTIFEEEDDTFSVGVYRTKWLDKIIIYSESTVSTEYRIKKSADKNPTFKCFLERRRDHEYYVYDHPSGYFILTNEDSRNYKVMYCEYGKTDESEWSIFQDHDEDVFIENVCLFEDYVVILEKTEALNQLHIYHLPTLEEHFIELNEDCYTLDLGTNKETNTDVLRYTYSSLSTPTSVFSYNMRTKESQLLKQAYAGDDFDKKAYVVKRLWATARDGEEIPISMVYKKELYKKGKPQPLLQYAYGSYGITIDPEFSSSTISLLDRGFIYCITHIRGSQTRGRRWYDDGRLLNKLNTFNDYIDCSEFLINEGYTTAEMLFARGGSAGGMLMGGIANMRPDLYKGVVALVPFVDVLTTMLDDTIPLTTSEYDEWGNPNEKEYYEYMAKYSPIDNVIAQDYPNMLVMTGYHDSQVQYCEPAKWVATLRDKNTSKNCILFKTEMEAGHSGATGRYTRLKEVALQYAFVIGLTD